MLTLFSILQRLLVLLVALLNLLGLTAHTTTVDLYANPSSGYEWECSFDEDGILVLTDSYYTPDASTIFTGKGGGTRTFKFKALNSGNVKVTFDYIKKDNKETISVSQYTYTFHVDENGIITECGVQ